MLPKVESRYDHRKKNKGCLVKAPVVEKHIEAEMIRCFELALYHSCENKAKKKRFTEILYLALYVYFKYSRLSPPTPSFRTFHNKRKRKKILLYCKNFVKELVILFHRISVAPWGHVASTIKKKLRLEILPLFATPTAVSNRSIRSSP